MIADGEPQPLGDRGLPFFDTGIHELFDAAAVQTHDVIVVRTVIELEDGHAVLEVMTSDQTGRLKLRENAIDRGQPDVLVAIQ